MESSTTSTNLCDIHSSEMVVGSGKIRGCYVAGSPGNVTFRLEQQNGPDGYVGDADCVLAFVDLEQDYYNIYVTSDVLASFSLSWTICGNSGTATFNHNGNGLEQLVTAYLVEVPC